MRLIDADALIGKLHEWDMQDLYLPCHFEDMIDEQPTAYDVESVVKEFEKVSKWYIVTQDGLNFGEKAIRKDKAVDIVKRGGVE